MALAGRQPPDAVLAAGPAHPGASGKLALILALRSSFSLTWEPGAQERGLEALD